MKPNVLTIVLLGLASSSCDKVEDLANKTKSAVESLIAKNAGESGASQSDPALQKLVDETPEGFVFRKDLPLPGKIEVRTTRIHELSGRFFEASAIESHAQVVKGTQTTVTKLERAGSQVRYTLEQSTFAEPVIEGADKSKQPAVKELAPPSKPRVFGKSGTAWKSDNSEGFRAAALSQQLGPVFDSLLVENALAPRALWFGKRRFKIGDTLAVSGESLPMLVTGDAKGSLDLTFESVEAVKGHPCGVFAVTGHFSRKQFADFEGNFSDEDVSVQSGKLWLSLIYPLILREETDTIQSTKSGGGGGLAARGQGSVKVSVIREWKATGP
jgi:hypothetical protein